MVCRKSSQFFSDLLYILQISFIIISTIMRGSIMNLRGFFSFLFLQRFQSSYLARLLLAFCELAGVSFTFITKELSHPFSAKNFRSLSFRLYIQFVFLEHENITLTRAIFHPISNFHFQIITSFALREQKA